MDKGNLGHKEERHREQRGFYLANESAHRHVKRRVLRESDRPSALELIDCKSVWGEGLAHRQGFCADANVVRPQSCFSVFIIGVDGVVEGGGQERRGLSVGGSFFKWSTEENGPLLTTPLAFLVSISK